MKYTLLTELQHDSLAERHNHAHSRKSRNIHEESYMETITATVSSKYQLNTVEERYLEYTKGYNGKGDQSPSNAKQGDCHKISEELLLLHLEPVKMEQTNQIPKPQT